LLNLRPAIRQAGSEWTYAQLNDQANRIATGLIKMGVKPGQHIGLCAPNSANWIIFYFGVLKAGAVAVTLSGVPTGDELVRLVNHSKPRLIFAPETKLGDLEKKLGRLRYCFSAAASMPVEIVKQWKERTGITISEAYGMTEGMPVTYNHYYRHVVGSVGQPVHGVEVQIRDTSGNQLEQGREGEICVRARMVMKAYLDNPEESRSALWEGGWLRSGDIGVFDPDGYLYIVDRLKDLIITGGENVYPREVEEALYARPEVEECAVIGLPDREWGERVTACIVPRPGHSVVPEELRSFLKSRLSPFKIPKEYVVVSELPKSAAGKILKRQLKKQFLEGHR
jgi:long-chain acyl-CoA synthetase